MSPLPNPLPDTEAQCRQLADLIRSQLHHQPALLGIYSGGAWIAERLKELLGLPTHADGTPHDITRLAQNFGERLQRRFNLPVGFADERLTSLDAETRLRETGRNSKSAKPLLDAVAAQLILQTWFESPHHVTPAQPPA